MQTKRAVARPPWVASGKFMLIAGLFCLSLVLGPDFAFPQSAPSHAEGLTEELMTIQLDANRQQAGVYFVKTGTQNHSKLAVLLPGYPSVVRPVVEGGAMVRSKLTGNFLIRSRRHLSDESIATFIVDCQSESGDYCSAAYQSSNDRRQWISRWGLPGPNGAWLQGNGTADDESHRHNHQVREAREPRDPIAS